MILEERKKLAEFLKGFRDDMLADSPRLAELEEWIKELEEDHCFLYMPDLADADEDGYLAEEGECLAELLEQEIAFTNTRSYDESPWRRNKRDENEVVPIKEMEETTVIFINTNDILMWGCADAESIKDDELGPFLKRFRERGFAAQVELSCRKNNMQPQKPVIDILKNNGHWTEELAALPLNPDQGSKK